MAKLTERENYLKILRGETPDWVPKTAGARRDPYGTFPQADCTLSPSFYQKDRTPDGGGMDIWGVPFVATKESGDQALPVPNKFILEDIRKWRDVIKAPDISGIDWAAMAKKDVERAEANAGVSTKEMVCQIGTFTGFFQYINNFMGFTNGLMAMFEEPEEVHALFDYLCNFYVKMVEKQLDHYPADVLNITDDTAAIRQPFISKQMYQDLVKPYHKRLAQVGIDRGLFIQMHNCGRCEDFIDDWKDFNTVMWNPAQIYNDLDGIKKKYGNGMIISGGWDSQGKVGQEAPFPEADLRKMVRDTIDRFGPGGGFVFRVTMIGPKDAQWVKDRLKIVTEEYEKYREAPYK